MQYTFSLFQQFYENLPLLVPALTKETMFRTLKDLETYPEVSVAEIEDIMIKFGYEVWPYAQAYKDFLLITEEKMGEEFLLGFLSPDLQNKFLNFKLYGGSFHNLHTGQAISFFEPEEKNELCVALINISHSVKDFTKQEILGLKRKDYLEKVAEFEKVLKNIQTEIRHLYKLASEEQDHPSLAREIKETAKSFEHSLCLLGQEFNEFAICNSVEFFNQRKQHLNNMHGIHNILEVGFYKN